jgi:hypothetical protein
VDQLAECIRKIKEDPTVRTHSDADGHDDFFQGQIGCFFFSTLIMMIVIVNNGSNNDRRITLQSTCTHYFLRGFRTEATFSALTRET